MALKPPSILKILGFSTLVAGLLISVLLNISFLNNFGYKISKIATLTVEECNDLVKSIPGSW